jgi:hypothetical protein
VKQNEVIDGRRASSVANVTISFIEFVFTKEHSSNCSFVMLMEWRNGGMADGMAEWRME